MLKRNLIAIVCIFLVWSILDFLIHSIILQETYESTAQLWRPMEEMNMPLMYVVSLIYAICFVLIYSLYISNKSLSVAIKYGVLMGLAMGIPMGFGSYSYMPIPLILAFSWFFGTFIEAVLAGLVVGLIIKPQT